MVNNLNELKKGMEVIIFDIFTGKRFYGEVKKLKKDSFLFETYFGSEYKVEKPKLSGCENHKMGSWTIEGSSCFYEIYDRHTQESKIAEKEYDFLYEEIINNTFEENESVKNLETRIRILNYRLQLQKETLKSGK